MALHRPNTSSICIKGKACVPVESNYFYNDFVLSTSGTTLRLATLVKAAPEVAILTTKTICRPSAALRIQRSRFWASKNALVYWKRRNNCLTMLLPLPWSGWADGKKYLGTAKHIRSIDHIGTPSQNIRLGQLVYQSKADITTFWKLVQP